MQKRDEKKLRRRGKTPASYFFEDSWKDGLFDRHIYFKKYSISKP